MWAREEKLFPSASDTIMPTRKLVFFNVVPNTIYQHIIKWNHLFYVALWKSFNIHVEIKKCLALEQNPNIQWKHFPGCSSFQVMDNTTEQVRLAFEWKRKQEMQLIWWWLKKMVLWLASNISDVLLPFEYKTKINKLV